LKKYVVLAGNIGAGKTSLVGLMCELMGWKPYFEPVAENPYLADFYGDMKRWALNSQLFFLVRRFRIHREMEKRAAADPRAIVQDRTIYEDAEVFAAHLSRAGHISERDWRMYQDLYRTLCAEIRKPDLMIYLRCPLKTLVKRIQQRGRDFEKAIPRKYLASLERLYEEWFARYDLSPTVVIETDRLDYVERMFDRLEVVEAIERHIGKR
jgi:deoxyadenosine/deoxycytidine kinase